jgi:hypothetical protein
MKIMTQISVAAFAAALVLSATACKKKEETAAVPAPAPAPAAPAPVALDVINVPVSVKQVTLSNKIDEATKQAAIPMSSFAASDTIYAVVDTIGSGKTAIKALWTYHKGDKTAQVNETVQEIDAAGPASTEFHVSKPSGWPVGDYQVEVFLNGTSASVQKFTVK